jgi:hypothetical protein
MLAVGCRGVPTMMGRTSVCSNYDGMPFVGIPAMMGRPSGVCGQQGVPAWR